MLPQLVGIIGWVLSGLSTGSVAEETASLVLRGGTFFTGEDGAPPEAIAIRGDRIVAVGTRDDIAHWIGPETRVIEAEGRFVMPGFVESHAHLLGIGRARRTLDLVGTTSVDEVLDKVAARVKTARPGEWILGRGWDQNDWPVKTFPTAAQLEAVSDGHPVLLTRIDGHAAWTNRTALRRAEVDRRTVDPGGGELIRDPEGQPTGVLIDGAIGLVSRLVPADTDEERERDLRAAVEECLRLGITSFHDAGVSQRDLELYERAIVDGWLPIRVYAMLSGSDERLLERYFELGPILGRGAGHLTVRSIKLYADGALGSRGAALLEPYSDRAGHLGLNTLSPERLAAVCDLALERGFQVAVHAIGDAGNRMVLDGFEAAFARHPSVRDPRFRIEHAQILDGADIPRFAELGVIASMQAVHATSDMPWVPDRLGAARSKEGAYVWKSLLESGAVVCNGTDAPVERLSPFECLYATVTRQDADGQPAGGWYPEQRLSRAQALASFTSAGATAGFQEEQLGRLSAGRLADLIVVDRDLLTVSPMELREAAVVTTIVGGRVRHESSQ